MKTAIILTGHMRTFEKCLPTMHWHVFRHFPEADFFVSTIEDADAQKAALLRVKYPNARVEIEAVKEQPDCIAELRAKGVELPAEFFRGRMYTHEPYAISAHPQAVLRQLWQLEQGWKLIMKSIPIPDHRLVIRCRPDLWFHSTQLWMQDGESIARTPWWGKFGGVNDRFALLGWRAAAAYFQTYSRIPELMANGCPLHPESLLAESLRSEHCISDTVFAEFSTLRSNGEMRPPEISAIDLARLHQ